MQFLAVTERANAFATCTPVLGRLYRRFGFSVLQKEACRIEGEPYSLIHGTVDSVREAIALDRAQASSVVRPPTGGSAPGPAQIMIREPVEARMEAMA